MAEIEEELRSLLMRVKEDSENAGLKLNIQKLRSRHRITSRHGKRMETKVETVTDFIFSIFKITAGGDCSHEMKRCLLFGRKATTNLDSVLKIRDFGDKGPYSQTCGFSGSHGQT